MYYEATVQVQVSEDKPKFKRETYLVQDEAVSGVEVQMNELFKSYTLEWKLTQVKESNIVQVVTSGNTMPEGGDDE
jgi:hypothetical protein